MSKTIQTILIVILIAIQCVNGNNQRLEEIKLLIRNQTNEKIEKSVQNCKLFRSSVYLRRQLENLKLWKRRRRVYNLVTRKFRVRYGKLRLKRRAVELDEELDSMETTLSGLRVPLPTSSLQLIVRFKQEWPVELWRRYGLFHDDYLLLINSHWMQFPPPEKSVQYALGGLYIVMMAIGCTGNALVLLMYFRCRSLRTPGNILVANLALSDFLMMSKIPIFVFNSFNLGPALGKTGCVIYGFVGGLTGTASITTLSAIALDRYWAVARPLEAVRALTAIRARLMAVGTWIYACIFSIIPALDIGYGRYVPEGYLTSCSFDYLTNEEPARIFIFIFFCAAWLAPFCTIAVCYTSIFHVVVFTRNVATKKEEHRLSSRHVKEQVKRKAEIKLAFLVIVVIALFFISWTPYAVVALLGIFGKKDLITPIGSMFPALFCKTTACINPFIYLITHPKFRMEFKQLIFNDKSKRYNSTIKTIGYTEATKWHRPSKDLSEMDVEVVEMKDIPYKSDEIHEKPESREKIEMVKTVSSRVSEREGSQRSVSMKSFDDNVVSPPSWYVKPQFVKKKSFHRRSSRSVASSSNDIIV